MRLCICEIRTIKTSSSKTYERDPIQSGLRPSPSLRSSHSNERVAWTSPRKMQYILDRKDRKRTERKTARAWSLQRAAAFSCCSPSFFRQSAFLPRPTRPSVALDRLLLLIAFIPLLLPWKFERGQKINILERTIMKKTKNREIKWRQYILRWYSAVIDNVRRPTLFLGPCDEMWRVLDAHITRYQNCPKMDTGPPTPGNNPFYQDEGGKFSSADFSQDETYTSVSGGVVMVVLWEDEDDRKVRWRDAPQCRDPVATRLITILRIPLKLPSVSKGVWRVVFRSVHGLSRNVKP